MSYKHFEYVNCSVSSEMFYSLMAILHERLPCAKGFYRLKRSYRDKHLGEARSNSPIRTIASPKMIRGLSIKKKRGGGGDGQSEMSSPSRISSPEFRIKNAKNSDKQKVLQMMSSTISNNFMGGAASPKMKDLL